MQCTFLLSIDRSAQTLVSNTYLEKVKNLSQNGPSLKGPSLHNIYQDKTPKRGHQVGSEKEKQEKKSLKSPWNAILCNDIIAC